MAQALTQVTKAQVTLPYLHSFVQVMGASLFLACCAQISIPLTPVPLTAQTLGVMLVGATLGSRKGALAILAYLFEGALGFPVFAGGASGLLKLAGPTGGYLIGFVLQAYFVGWFVERQNALSSVKTLGVLLFSCLVQLGLGVLWLSSFVGLGSALILGFYPFVLGEIVKSTGLAAYLKK